jgi:hypothetical protein
MEFDYGRHIAAVPVLMIKSGTNLPNQLLQLQPVIVNLQEKARVNDPNIQLQLAEVTPVTGRSASSSEVEWQRHK